MACIWVRLGEEGRGWRCGGTAGDEKPGEMNEKQDKLSRETCIGLVYRERRLPPYGPLFQPGFLAEGYFLKQRILVLKAFLVTVSK